MTQDTMVEDVEDPLAEDSQPTKKKLKDYDVTSVKEVTMDSR
jgi:hypothetical protein